MRPLSASPGGRRRCPWALSRGSRRHSRGLSGLPYRTPRNMWTGCVMACAVAMRSLAAVWRKSRRSMTAGGTERWRRMRWSAPCQRPCGRPRRRRSSDAEFLALHFCLSQHLLKMHVAPGNRDLLPFWLFFGLKRPWPAG